MRSGTLLALLLLVVAGCRRRPPAGAEGAWSFLVHMAADAEDLYEFAELDRADLEKTRVRGVHVSVQLDEVGGTGWDRPDGDLPEATPPDEALRTFLDWGMRERAADRVAVVVWGHGLGWRPETPALEAWTATSCQGGVGWDAEPIGVIDTPSLADAVWKAARTRGRPLDLLVLDACLMQTVEVLAALDGSARFVVGSEQIGSYLGLPYAAILEAAAGATPRELASAIPGLHHAHASPADERTLTASAVDMSRLPALLDALDDLGAALEGWIEEDPIRREALTVLLRDCAIPDFLCGSRDLGVVLAALEALDPELPTEPAREAARQAVISSSLGSGYPRDCEPRIDTISCADPCWTGMLGVSVWLPQTAEEWSARRSFFASSPARSGAWGAWPDQVWP